MVGWCWAIFYSNNIKNHNDNYRTTFFYFLDNMKKLIEKHLMRKEEEEEIVTCTKWDMEYQNPEFSVMYFENKLLIVREATNSANSIGNWTAKERRDN